MVEPLQVIVSMELLTKGLHLFSVTLLHPSALVLK